MHRDTAMCGHWMSDYIVEGTYYADDERVKINNEKDPKKRRTCLHKKINLTHDFFFAAAGVELPSGKVMHAGRVVGMNDLKEKGAEKSDVTTTSRHKASDQNREIAQEYYFSMCPPPAMHIATGVKVDEDWHVSGTAVPTF